MGNHLCPHTHRCQLDWGSLVCYPSVLVPLMMTRTLETVWIVDLIDDDCLSCEQQLTVLQMLDRKYPSLWPLVYDRCSPVERIQLFKGERDRVIDELGQLVTTCQEPSRARMLSGWLCEADLSEIRFWDEPQFNLKLKHR